MAPMALINPALQPTTISQPSDATALVNAARGQARSAGGGGAGIADAHQRRQRPRQAAGTSRPFTGALSAPSGSTPGVSAVCRSDQDATLKNQVRCTYVKAANTADMFGNPAALDPTKDPLIIGRRRRRSSPRATSDGDSTLQTATVMKLVINGYAGAGTITLGGYDYHDGTRATGETRNFKAGQMIGAVLEYAQRKQTR